MKLTITSGNHHLDGEYELDISDGFDFKKTEWFIMKDRVGVTVADFQSGKFDMNTLTAMALVMLSRAGKPAQVLDAYMETTDSQTLWDMSDMPGEEDEALPPLTGSDGNEDASASGMPSGPTTNGSSEPSRVTTPAPTGGPTSATTATSPHLISVISHPSS